MPKDEQRSDDQQKPTYKRLQCTPTHTNETHPPAIEASEILLTPHPPPSEGIVLGPFESHISNNLGNTALSAKQLEISNSKGTVVKKIFDKLHTMEVHNTDIVQNQRIA